MKPNDAIALILALLLLFIATLSYLLFRLVRHARLPEKSLSLSYGSSDDTSYRSIQVPPPGPWPPGGVNVPPHVPGNVNIPPPPPPGFGVPGGNVNVPPVAGAGRGAVNVPSGNGNGAGRGGAVNMPPWAAGRGGAVNVPPVNAN